MPRKIAVTPHTPTYSARVELFRRIGLPEPLQRLYRDISAATARAPSPEHPEGLPPISRQHIANVLLGKSQAKSDVLWRLAKVGEITVDELLDCLKRLRAEGMVQGAITSRKISEEEEREIRRKKDEGMTCREIAAEHENASRQIVSQLTRKVPRGARSHGGR